MIIEKEIYSPPSVDLVAVGVQHVVCASVFTVIEALTEEDEEWDI